MKNLILLSLVVIVWSCINASEKNVIINIDNNTIIESKDFLKENYTMLYTFKDKEGNVIGTMYANMIKENVFTSLIIVGRTESDTLYTIKQNIFSNKNRIDLKVNNDNFYGYRLELKKDDYFVIVYLQNEGLNISDPVTIEWNYSTRVFEIMKAP